MMTSHEAGDDRERVWMGRALAEAARGAGPGRAEPDGRRGRGAARGGSSVSGTTSGSVARMPRSTPWRRPARRRGGRRSSSPWSPAATPGRPPPAPPRFWGREWPGSSRRCATRSRRSTAAGSRVSRRRASRSRGAGGGPGAAAQRAVPQAAGDGPAVRRRQVGDDARRQDGGRLGRQPLDLRAAVAGPRPRAAGGRSTRSSSGSGRPWPTTPC